jgi:ribonuclease-3
MNALNFSETLFWVLSYHNISFTLADIAKKLDIGSHLFLGKGENASGGRKKVSLLANAFEAVLAAVYLDGGFKNANSFVVRHLDRKIKALIKKDMLYDYKNRL